jgi:predicted transcriptional regulator
MTAVVEVLEPRDLTVGELTAKAREGHEGVLRASVDIIESAAYAGDALLQLKPRVPAGTWRQWIEDNLPITYASAHLYMRCAENRALIREQGWTRINEVKTGLGELIAPNHKGKGRTGRAKPEWMKDLARSMRNDGENCTAIARELGVSPAAVRCWVDPEYEALSRRKVAAINKRRIQGARLLREQERAAAIKRAVRKAGAAEQELYAMAERMQDAMGQAHREATDPEKRQHYALAGQWYRRMRDEIVRGLGVQ